MRNRISRLNHRSKNPYPNPAYIKRSWNGGSAPRTKADMIRLTRKNCIIPIIFCITFGLCFINIIILPNPHYINEPPKIETETRSSPNSATNSTKKFAHCWEKTTTQEEDPCKSVESLTRFLHQQDDSIFSKFNPVCPNSAKNRVHVAIPSYDFKESTIREIVSSALNQHYPQALLQIWLYNDGSNSLNIQNVCDVGCDGDNVFDFSPIVSGNNSDRIHVSRFTNEIGLKLSDIPPLVCFQSTRHLGPGGAKYWLFRLVSSIAGPNDIIMILDGDSLLPKAAEIVNQKYIDETQWFTYGSHKEKWSGQPQQLRANVTAGKEKFTPRSDSWWYGYPHTFKAHLLDHIERTDLTHSDGTWLSKAIDHGYVYKMLELSGGNRVSYIPQQIYNDNYSPETSTLVTESKGLKSAQTLHIQSLKPSKKLLLPIHIVFLTWKRIYLLEHQLMWLQQQTDLNNQTIHFHIINNNWDKRDEVDAVVANFTERWHKDNKETVENHKGTPMMDITVTHSDKDNLFHCFARFLYVDKLRNSVPLDFVIFLDDDQYWIPTFISSLLKEHKPKGMTTWYGKSFKATTWYGKLFAQMTMWYNQIFKGRGMIADYWHSKLVYVDIIKGKMYDEFPTFKYAGPGGSIIDAHLWTFRHQLLRLKWDLSKWSKIDDIWLSYVMDALLGWELRRLHPPLIPVDIGKVQSPSYRDQIKNVITIDQGLQLMYLKNTENTREVATFLNSTVDKQGVFEELQTTYRWDVYN